MDFSLSSSIEYLVVKGSLVKLIVVTVGISLTAASLYTAFTLSGQSKVSDYIPEDSAFISHFHYGNGSYYVFATNSSYGLITETPVLQVVSTISSARTNHTVSTNISITAPLSYKGFTIFEFQGVGLPELMNLLGINMFNENITIPLAELSIYATELSQQYSIVGSLGGVLSSINASLQHTGFSKFTNYINENIPFSSAVFTGNATPVSKVSINVTENDTFVTLSSTNPFPFPLGFNFGGIPIGVHNISNQSITFEIGLGWIQIQAMLANLISSIYQFGGLNVQNTTGIPVLL